MVVPLQLLAFLQGLFTFYHEGYELAHEFEPYKQQLQFNLQNVSVPTPVGGGRRWRRRVGGRGGWLVPGRAQKAAGRIITFSGLSRLDAAGQSFHKWKAARSDEILRRAGDQYFRLAWWAVTVGDLLASSQKKKKAQVKSRERSTSPPSTTTPHFSRWDQI